MAIIGLSALQILGCRGRAPGASVASSERPAAPDFTLQDLSGQQVILSRYHGKVVLLDFWATWCGPCRQEVPHFIGFQKKYHPQGLQIIGVSMDDGPEPVHAFYEEFKMNYPVAMGTAQVGEQYGGILGLPVAFLIDRNGRISSKHIGETDIAVLEKEIVALLGQQ